MGKQKKWFKASVDYLGGFGCGYGTKNTFVFTVSLRTARKRIKTTFEHLKGEGCIYDLGNGANRGINCLTEWNP